METMKRALLGGNKIELLEFINDKHNVHQDIRNIIRAKDDANKSTDASLKNKGR